MLDPARKIFGIEEAVKWRAALKAEGLSLSLTNGCFDLLHRGHAEYLLAARRLGDALIVLLNADSSIKALKGDSRPICPEGDRAFMLASLSFVDAVVIFDGVRCDREIAMLCPDIYVKGGDYCLENIDADEREAILSCGAKLHFIPLVKGLSTTRILEKMGA